MREDIVNILVDRLGRSVGEAGRLNEELKSLDSKLTPLLQRWLDTNTGSDDTLYSGYSINSLRESFGMDFIAALLTLDWIIKEPEAAIPAIESGVM